MSVRKQWALLYAIMFIVFAIFMLDSFGLWSVIF